MDCNAELLRDTEQQAELIGCHRAGRCDQELVILADTGALREVAQLAVYEVREVRQIRRANRERVERKAVPMLVTRLPRMQARPAPRGIAELDLSSLDESKTRILGQHDVVAQNAQVDVVEVEDERYHGRQRTCRCRISFWSM